MGGHALHSAMKGKEKIYIKQGRILRQMAFKKNDEEVDGKMLDNSGGKHGASQNWLCRFSFFIFNIKTLTNH